jgi:hypothetical protein
VGRNNHYKLETHLTEAIPQTLGWQNTSRREVCVLKVLKKTKLVIIDPDHIIHNKKSSHNKLNFQLKQDIYHIVLQSI